MKTVYNGKVITEEEVLSPGYVVFEKGLITEVCAGDPPDGLKENGIDANGGWIAPGLVDVHIHGNANCWSFMKKDEILMMAESLLKNGVTGFLATTVSLPQQLIISGIDAIKSAMESQDAGADYDTLEDTPTPVGSRILGINLEGPYINPEHGGAHIPTVIRPSKKEEIDEMLEHANGTIKMMTFAPEIENGMELIDWLTAAGIVPVIGHTDATVEQTNAAIDRGASHFTHLFNACRGFHQREPGCSFAALNNPKITVELIFDTKHVHPDAARIAIKTKSVEGIMLITDAISAAGLPDGEYSVWGFPVIVKDGTVKLQDGTIAGSILSLNEAVRNAISILGVTPPEAFRMASINGIRKLGLGDKAGSLVPGKVADIALFDADFNCLKTIIAGKTAYSAASPA
ncbi:MAG TPA: N-acetylglucosamine-6-phosphate deacetylase [bacterium]|nr:N-acetylglucosamine-6-phosphate deacetylase [bacterium]